MSSTNKTILIFCDGTGMDGTMSVGAPAGGGGSIQNATNVLRLSRAVKTHAKDGRRQLVFYQTGVGSEADFNGDQICVDTVIQALGTVVASKIRDAYVFLTQNFEKGDDICLFGGAYTVRKLSGLIDAIGLLPTEELGLFPRIWRELTEGKTPHIPPESVRTNIKCVGVWDTVGSIGGVSPIINALNIQDTSLPATVDVALHALSLQENRKKLLPTLWTPPQLGFRHGQSLTQVWFPGAHSDIGGGYKQHELADLALFWMAGHTESFINYDLDFLQRSGQRGLGPWGTSQPNNAYDDLPLLQKPVLGHETRLDLITQDSLFHPSLGRGYAPTDLRNSDYMITMDTLRSRFGASWNPKFVELSAFEGKCKKEWGILRNAPSISFDNIGNLFVTLTDQNPTWVRMSDSLTPAKFIPPQGSVIGGTESNGSPLYIIHASYKGGIHPGKIGTVTPAVIGYGDSEIRVDIFDILVAPLVPFSWVFVSGRFSSRGLNPRVAAFHAGNEADGTPLYVARGIIKGVQGVPCGKVRENSFAMIPYDGKEFTIEAYEVMVLLVT